MNIYFGALLALLFASTTSQAQTNMWKMGIVLEAIRIELEETPAGTQYRLNDVVKSPGEVNEFMGNVPASHKPICVILTVDKAVTAGQLADTMDMLCDTGFNYPMLIIKNSRHSHLVNLGGAEEYYETTY